jgi:gluconate 2-dehydrogenase gamma chain
MKNPDQDRKSGFSRRDLFKRAGALGVTAASSALIPHSAIEAAQPQAAPPAATQTEQLHAVQALTSQQFATLTAITGRIFPTDENGPGAIEGHASTYIDRALTSHYAYQKDNYTANLSVLDDYCKATYQDSFAALPPEKQDAVLTAMEGNKVDKSFGFTPDARTFFNLVLEHTQEGMFSDPYYGGNANFIGWDLLDFPGVKLEFTEQEQGLNFPIEKAHRSTYSYNMFKERKQ